MDSVVAVAEDGRPVRVLLLRPNVLVAGIAGAGKSGILNIIIATLAACRDVALWGVDLKSGMELQPWAARFDRLATTPEEATRLFRDAVASLNHQARDNAAAGKRVHEPAPDDPALIIITDEHAELPAEAHEAADSIARGADRTVTVSEEMFVNEPRARACARRATRAQCAFTFTITPGDRDARPGPPAPAAPAMERRRSPCLDRPQRRVR